MSHFASESILQRPRSQMQNLVLGYIRKTFAKFHTQKTNTCLAKKRVTKWLGTSCPCAGLAATGETWGGLWWLCASVPVQCATEMVNALPSARFVPLPRCTDADTQETRKTTSPPDEKKMLKFSATSAVEAKVGIGKVCGCYLAALS